MPRRRMEPGSHGEITYHDLPDGRVRGTVIFRRIDGSYGKLLGDRRTPVEVVVTGAPGPDAYSIEAVTDGGIRSAELDVSSAHEALGFAGLVRALLACAAEGEVPAPWEQASAVVRNTVRAAELTRAS